MSVPGASDEMAVIRQKAERLKGFVICHVEQSETSGIIRVVEECLKQSEILRVVQNDKAYRLAYPFTPSTKTLCNLVFAA
jgi:hypothetical protein